MAANNKLHLVTLTGLITGNSSNNIMIRVLLLHMLVIMVRTVSKPSFSFPVSQYPTNGLKGEKLFPIIWETIEALELNALHVLSITSDGASANRKFYRLCQRKKHAVYHTRFKTHTAAQNQSICSVMCLIC